MIRVEVGTPGGEDEGECEGECEIGEGECTCIAKMGYHKKDNDSKVSVRVTPISVHNNDE